MGEYINIHLGGFGCRVGAEYWRLLELEYKSAGSDVNRHCDYTEGLFGGYHPRALMVGADTKVMADIDTYYSLKNMKMDCLMPCSDFEQSSIDGVMDALRMQLEDCDKFQGINIHHSVFSESSSIRSMKLLQALVTELPSACIQTFSLYPSGDWNCADYELYFATLVTNSLIECSTITNCFDNKAIIRMCSENSKIPKPTLRDMNQAVAQYLSGITCNYRFGGHLNTSLRKVCTNMVPFPRLHFMLPGQSHLGVAQTSHCKTDMQINISNCLGNANASLVSIDKRHGRFLSAQLFFRGSDLSSYHLEKLMLDTQYKNSAYFAEWIANNLSASYCSKAPVLSSGQPGFADNTVAAICNNTAAKGIFKGLNEHLDKMFKRKNKVYVMLNKGIEEMQIAEARANLKELAAEMQKYQDASAEEEYDEG